MARPFSARTFGLLLLALLTLLASPPRSTRGDDADLEKRKQDLLLRLRVHRAIDEGAVWVAARQQRDGSFRMEDNAQQGPFAESRHRFGTSALATYTLAHCGYTAERKEIKRAVAYLRKHYASLMKGEYWTQASAYSLSLVVLALHELYAREGADDQTADRARYGDSIRARSNPCGYPKWVRKMIRQILDWLLESRAKEGLFRYPGGLPGQPAPRRGGGGSGARPGGFGFPGGGPGRGPSFSGSEDLSNTQYVLLALWAGSRCGTAIEQKTLEGIANRLIAWQEADGPPVARTGDPQPEARGPNRRYGNLGPPDQTDRARGFGYTPGAPPTGSMTAAGLSSLAIVKAMLEERHALKGDLRTGIDRAAWDAIAWLTVNFSIRDNPRAGST
ncbi:MAG: prenyltransferase/squalene oxidase repeat-containing protein, partial [Planctomycetota bacterium]